MTQLMLSNAHILAADAPGWLIIEDGRIADLGEGVAPPLETMPIFDCSGNVLLPGFIDVHVHGAIGYDTMDATPEALHAMAWFFATHGVTSFLATTMTAPGDATRLALENIAQCVGPMENGATLLGAHLEGPYLNLKMKGAQAGEYVRRANPAEYKDWLDLGVIRQTTVAPEFAENQQFIRDCVAHEILVSIGHTAATYQEMEQALKLGVRQATHTFNAMGGVHHRNPGTAGAVLSMDEISCELIADNVHVHPAILKLTVRAKDSGRILLITDAIRGVGMEDGQYDLGGQTAIISNGTATLADGTLAGSVLTMDRALQNILSAAEISIADAWPMTSANAAAQLGMADRKGHVAVGYDADLVLLDSQNAVILTIAEGEVVYHVDR